MTDFSVREKGDLGIRYRECVRGIKSNREELELATHPKNKHNCGEVEYTVDVIKHTNKAINEHQTKFPYIHIQGGFYFPQPVHSSAFHSD
jgi:hypothetical protein